MGGEAGKLRSIAATMAACLVAASLFPLPVWAAASHSHLTTKKAAPALPQAEQRMAEWVAASADNGGLPFVIVDKQAAKVFVFDKDAHLLGAAWVLVGLAPGDDSAPGIGTMPLTAITPQMRTTPAGRFVTALGHDLGPLDVLWVDYLNAISMHRVINTNLAERRLERIVSPRPADHRISYGCINVPAKFFDSVVEPAFTGTKGIVYILPEVKSMRAAFPNYYETDGDAAPQAAAMTSVRYRKDAGSVEDHDPPGIVH
jgi:hypothetical protein